MQAEYHARGGDGQRQRHQHDGEFGKCRAGLPGERHGVQRVARREAVAIERRASERDAGVADEGPLAHEGALEEFVDGEAHGAGREHDQRNLQTLRAIDEGQREHERVPDDAVAEPARGLEEHADAGVLHAAVEPAAEPVFGRDRIEPAVSHGYAMG